MCTYVCMLKYLYPSYSSITSAHPSGLRPSLSIPHPLLPHLSHILRLPPPTYPHAPTNLRELLSLLSASHLNCI